ncbi:GNAT family N-acetyltransferase [Nonomuraea sp. NPDC050310]|uniref:GNAT family N-acetyltransferase n=1 Tax=unclassified Nonomuraea TaxID=2593643 RepID=UPI0033D6724B
MSITWGTLGEDDAEAVARLVADMDAVDRLGETPTAGDIRYTLGDPLLDLADGTLAARDGERIVAYGYLPIRQSAAPKHQMRLSGGVHPDFRRRGYGRRILDWALDAAPRLHERHYPGRPLELHVSADDRSAGTIALLQGAGFERMRWFLEMRADLREPAPRVEPPPGIGIVPWSPDLDEGARAVRNLAFRDHWGSIEHTAESWRHTMTGIRSFRPEASFLALDGERVVGILMTMHFAGEAAATGEKAAWIAIIGTLREWRGRGVAASLLSHALGEFRAQGYTTAGLGVDADNGTGAVGVYERAGFRAVHRGSVFVRKF